MRYSRDIRSRRPGSEPSQSASGVTKCTATLLTEQENVAVAGQGFTPLPPDPWPVTLADWRRTSVPTAYGDWASSLILVHISAMSSITLPQELFDIAIRYLSEDQTASRACALVCRFWLHPARQNIFQSVCLQFNDWTVADFLELLQGSPELGPYIRKVEWGLPMSSLHCPADSELAVSVVRRLAALSNDHSTTHEITIDLRRRHALYLLRILDHAPSIVSHITWICWGCGNGFRDWESDAAQALASRLRSIKDLTLAQWFGGPTPFVPTLPFQMIGDLLRPTSITTLKLENLVFTDGSQFLHFVHAFTALKHLSFEDVKWAENAADILSKGSPKAPPLQSIALKSSQPIVSAGVAKWLLDQPVAPHLETINASDIISSQEMNELVQRCAPSIINLTFRSEQVIKIVYSCSSKI
jgi:hypothetical protein